MKILFKSLILIFVSVGAFAQYTPEKTYESNSPILNFDLSINLDEVDFDALSKEQGKNYALLIAEQDYTDKSIRKLDKPIGDAQKLQKVLESYYTFDLTNTIFLKNPKRTDIIRSLENLGKTITEKDNLLIFYAGHGFYDEGLEIGYWLPSDASKNDRSSWFSNTNLRDYIKGIKSKHTLLIADACFSGGIFKTRNAFKNASAAIQQSYALPSRKAMTSGALKEVPDKSVFIEYLVKRLEQNGSPFLPAERLFYSMKDAVISNSPNGQVPQYGEIASSGNEGGDFIFVRKKK